MKILILGADGMLGHKLFQLLGMDYPETFGTISGKSSIYPYSGISFFHTDKVIPEVNMLDFGQIEHIINQLNPDYIINCLRVATHGDETAPPLQTITVNSLLPHQLAEVAKKNGARMIHFSSDCVFNGKQGMYTEEDPPNATHIYGQTRLLGEVFADNVLVLRGSVIGRELIQHSSLLDWFLRQQGSEINGFTHAIYSGLSSVETVRVVQMIISIKPSLTGLYHIASKPINKYNLLKLAQKNFGIKVTIHKQNKYFVNRSLAAEKIKYALGYVAPSWSSMMKELAEENEQYNKWGIKL